MLKKNNGITLIALVITIIVLLILAGISISAITGDDGIATRAKDAKEETRAGEVQEIVDLWKMDVSAKKIDPNWGNVKTENELLEEMLDSGKVKESEINRTNKTITIGSKVIDYSVNIFNPYELKPFTTNGVGHYNNVITLYNKNTGEYEDFGDNIIVEVDGEIVEGDVSDYIYIGYETDGYGYPDGTMLFDIVDYLSIRDDAKFVKITVNKNGTIVYWEGNVENIYPS